MKFNLHLSYSKVGKDSKVHLIHTWKQTLQEK